MKLLSIKYKLILSLSTILIFAFVAINIINYQVSKASVRKGIMTSSLPLTRDNIYSEIQADLMRPIFVSSLMANDTFLKDWALSGEKDINKIKKYLQEIKTRYGFFTSFYVSEKTGNYYHFKGVNKQISPDDLHDVWYYDFIKLNVDYDLDVDVDEASNNSLTIFINHRLKDYDGNLIGVTGVGLLMEQMTQLLDTYKKKYNRNVYLVDQNGLIQVHSNQAYIEKINLHGLPGIGSLTDRILESSSEPGIYEFDDNGNHILVTARFIPELDWFLVVEQNQNEALAGIYHNFLRNMIFALIIICIVIAINIFTINYFQGKLENMAVTDKLTGAFNRRELEFSFEKSLKSAKKLHSDLSVILIDIDHFKEINDQHGHLVGDTVIKKVVHLINQCIRDNDVLVRWGGDEFMTLTPSSLSTALSVANRIRDAIAGTNFITDSSTPFNVTISCGVAQFKETDSVDSLTKRADEALYAAKESGRNNVKDETCI